MGVGAGLPVEPHRDDLAGLGVVAKAGGIGHADEFIFDQRLVEGQRLRQNFFYRLGVGAIGDDEIFSVIEPIGPARKGGTRQRHGVGAAAYFVDFHDFASLIILSAAHVG